MHVASIQIGRARVYADAAGTNCEAARWRTGFVKSAVLGNVGSIRSASMATSKPIKSITAARTKPCLCMRRKITSIGGMTCR